MARDLLQPRRRADHRHQARRGAGPALLRRVPRHHLRERLRLEADALHQPPRGQQGRLYRRRARRRRFPSASPRRRSRTSAARSSAAWRASATCALSRRCTANWSSRTPSPTSSGAARPCGRFSSCCPRSPRATARCSSRAPAGRARSCLPGPCTSCPGGARRSSWPSTAARCRTPCWNRNCSATRPARSPTRGATSRAASRWPRGHHLPGRDRRHLAGHAGAAAARVAGAGL